ncbi:FadR/GntR family transcriptional regulator [Succiniclasticum ruminis]|uniref:Transcriptional regulator, GntR family n=1 Tax=Succiniclasticum ruminis DSM 9236 TaxID=1123323 RepID=A0A1I2CK42_9FIRM|nr:FadR/GntR family transcriptional regulator [Succiniclasticum ruminis]SFE68769.1 transcriptional regulator, GntR family [Succiniclasticum ruminis DSM 9236]
MTLKPISQKKSIVNDVIQELCNYILGGVMDGTIHKGDKIPSERELSEQLGIGRSTLREAIKVLVMLGLLEIRQGQGTYISEGNDGFYTAPLSWGLIIGFKSVSEIAEIRVILESEAARLATQRGGNQDMKQLDKIIANMHDAVEGNDVKAFTVADVEFHMTIVQATGNAAIVQMLKTIRRLLEIWIEKVLVDKSSMLITLKEHEAVYEHMRLGDAEGACEAMRKHISAAGMRLKKVSVVE